MIMRHLLRTTNHLDSRECPLIAELIDGISLTMINLLSSSSCRSAPGGDSTIAMPSQTACSMTPITSLSTELNGGHQKLSSSQVDAGS